MGVIFNQTIVPLIREAVGTAVFCEQSLYIYNLVEPRLAPLIDRVMSESGCICEVYPMRSKNKPLVELHLTILDCKERKPKQATLNAVKELSSLIKENGGAVHLKA